MFHSRKNVTTVRRSSQRRNNRRLGRIQRQIALETIVSNISCLAYQQSTTLYKQPSLQSTQPVKNNSNKDVDNLSLSMSSSSLNISDVQIHVNETKSISQIDAINEDQSEENRQLSYLYDSKQITADEELVQDLNSCENSDEDNEKEKSLKDSDDEESSLDADDDARDDDDDDGLFNNPTNHTDREFTTTEIAVALSLLKSRHSLTNTCISNICKLLKLLRVSNCPSNFRHVRSLICKPYQATISAEALISCPSCHKISSNSINCTSSSTCLNKEKFLTSPTVSHILYIEPQIRAVLERNNLIQPGNNENITTDIVDSPFYHKLLHTERNPFITLLMNSDGAVIKSISRSIWVTTFVINELPPSVRFNRENLIIGMLSVGSSKPKKDEMQIFLDGLVKQLVYLENNGLGYNPPNSPSHTERIVRVYLIAATCDMPATSLLINHTESNGFFGCIHCKIIGENVKVGEGTARAFAYQNHSDIELRSNASYDEAIQLLEQPLGKRRRASINSINNGLDGLRGRCAFRALKYFDVYQSFTSDTLHTLYEGATARMLQIFFGNVSQKSGITKEMSVKKAIDVIASTFKSMSYPSSTYRIPRDLKLHTVYKANEFKIFLLFGFSVFNHILTQERYDHFRCLAFAAHLIEASKHDQSTYLEILDLLQEFDERFEGLYTKQRAKPVIHALRHFPHSVHKYGPAHNYSTFEFESTVAQLTKTIHNGNKPIVELLRNIDLLQQTWLATTDPAFPPEMRVFERQIHCNMRYSIPTCLSDLDYHHYKTRLHRKISISSLEMDVSNFILKFTNDRSYLLFKTIFVDHQRYSADPVDIHCSTHDGCVLYDRNGTPNIGFLQTIIRFIDNNELSLVIRPVILYSTGDTLMINNRIYRCTNVLYGTSHGSSIEAIDYKSLIQKLAFRYGTDLNFPPLIKSMFFFQFPNLRSST